MERQSRQTWIPPLGNLVSFITHVLCMCPASYTKPGGVAFTVALLRTLRGGGVLENLWEATEDDDEVGSLVVHVDRHSSLAGEAELKAQPHGMWPLSIVFLEASRAPLTRTTPEGSFMHPLDRLHPIGGFPSTPHP